VEFYHRRSNMALKPQFKGVALLAHGLASGMDDWKISRWQREFANIKAMGADTVWYTPIQFGRHSLSDADQKSSFMQHQIGIHQAALKAKLKVGIFLGLNDIAADTWMANPKWRADKSAFFPEEGEACPSIPAAWREIMCLRDHLFKMLPHTDYLFIPPSDYGGCACQKCAPWGEKYLYFYKKQVVLCKQYNPNIKIVASGMGMPLDQVDLLRNKLRSVKWVDFVADVPRGCGKGIVKFYKVPEITMIRGWGAFGAAPILEQIRRFYRAENKSVVGIMPYSEGIHDDINRFACLTFASEPNRSCGDVAIEYAMNWLHLSQKDAERVAFVIHGLNRPIYPNEAYLDPDRGVRNPLADQRVKTLMDIREKNPSLNSNYRYWLLLYSAVTQALQTIQGNLNAETLCAEADNCRAAFLRLEPEYGRFLTEKIHIAQRSGMHPWIWARVFHTAWKREKQLERNDHPENDTV